MFGKHNENTVSTWDRKRQPVITSFFQSTRSQSQKGLQDPSKSLFFPTDDFKTLEELQKSNGRAKVMVNDKELALFNFNGKVYAVQQACPHSGGPLHLGDIEEVPGCGPCVKCPWHKYTFSLTTGQCIFPQNREIAGKLEVFPVNVEMENLRAPIKIGFSEFSSKVFTTPPE